MGEWRRHLSDLSFLRPGALLGRAASSSTATLGCASMVRAAKPAQARVPVLLRRRGIPNLQGPNLSDTLRCDLHAGAQFFARLYLAEAERPVQRLDGFLHATRFHEEGNVVFRGALRDGD